MSVDLKRLPEDEEIVRTMTDHRYLDPRAVQNVLDALNWFRCKAMFAEQELTRDQAALARANAELIEVRNCEERNGVAGRQL